MSCIQAILTIMLSMPAYHLDRGDSAAERRALYRPVAEAICAVGKTRLERAWLLVQHRAETNGARCVLEERCRDCRKGERCDWSRSLNRPLSTGPWQVKRRWCRRAVLAPTLLDRYVAGAQCALTLARGGIGRCRTVEGMFAAQLGNGRCHARWAAKRARRVELMIGRVP